jgi:CIC family chloride channel protein
VLCVAKLIATVFAYSSGGTGGIFAPALFIGGMLGAAMGHFDQLLLGPAHSQVGAFALVGMGAVFAAIIRAPMTSVLIIVEMTGNYKLVLPLMISNAVAYILARRWQGSPIYEALLEQDGIDLPHGAKMQPLLRSLTVSSAMTPHPVVIDARWTIDEAFQRIKDLPYAAYPVVDADGRMVGILTEARIRRSVAEGMGAETTHSQARVREFLRAGQTLRDALSAMHRLGIRQMCVVDDELPTRLMGVLTMSDVTRAALLAERTSVVATPLATADQTGV